MQMLKLMFWWLVETIVRILLWSSLQKWTHGVPGWVRVVLQILTVERSLLEHTAKELFTHNVLTCILHYLEGILLLMIKMYNTMHNYFSLLNIRSKWVTQEVIIKNVELDWRWRSLLSRFLLKSLNQCKLTTFSHPNTIFNIHYWPLMILYTRFANLNFIE